MHVDQITPRFRPGLGNHTDSATQKPRAGDYFRTTAELGNPLNPEPYFLVDHEGLEFDGLTQTADSTADRGSSLRVDRPGAAGNALGAGLCPAMPDAYGRTLDRVLSAERASVGGVLSDFHFLHLFSERRSITGTILSDNADLSRALTHCGVVIREKLESKEGRSKGVC